MPLSRRMRVTQDEPVLGADAIVPLQPENAEHHVTWDYLCAHAAGLICLTGGPEGPVNDALLAGAPSGQGRALRVTAWGVPEVEPDVACELDAAVALV